MEENLFLFIMSILSNTELLMMHCIVVRRRSPLSGKSLRHPCHVFPCDYGYVSIVFCPPPHCPHFPPTPLCSIMSYVKILLLFMFICARWTASRPDPHFSAAQGQLQLSTHNGLRGSLLVLDTGCTGRSLGSFLRCGSRTLVLFTQSDREKKGK